MANGDSGGESALAQRIEELIGRDIAAHGPRRKPGEGVQELVDVIEFGDAIGVEAEVADAFEEVLIGVLPPFGEHAGIEFAPGFVVGL